MAGSALTAFPYIQEGSEATPGLFNNLLSIISGNIAEANNSSNISSNVSTLGMVTINANSNVTDYIHFHDPSNARSDYLLGSFTTGTADGLNLYDVSGNTMIVSFSKQSVRFYQPITGPVFDTGGGVFNVRAFGATGDGITDDTGAIQLAINAAQAAGGGTVYCSIGTYALRKPATDWCLSVDSDNIRILGERGTALLLSSSSTVYTEMVRVNTTPSVTTRQKFTCESMTIDMNGLQTGVGLRLMNGRNCLITRNTIRRGAVQSVGVFSYGVRVEGTTTPPNPMVWGPNAPANFAQDVRVTENLIESFTTGVDYPSGIFVVTTDGAVVANNDVNGGGIGVIIYGPSRNIAVVGNEVSDAGNEGIRCQFDNISGASKDVYGLRDVTITGNTIRNAQTDGIRLNGYLLTCTGNVINNCGNSGIKADAAQNIVISANQADNNANRGIYMSQSAISGTGTYANITIIGNQVTNNGAYGIDVIGGGDSGGTAATGIRIIGNTCISNGSTTSPKGWAGIKVWDADDTCQIANNYCSGNGAAGSDGAGIYLRATLLPWGGATLAYNRVSGFSGTASTARQPFGIRFDAASGITLKKNYLYFNDCSDLADTTDSGGAAINTTAALSAGAIVQGQFMYGTLYRNVTYGVNRAALGVSLNSQDIITQIDETGNIELIGTASGWTVGSAIAPANAFGSEVSLGWYRSAASTMALSYGTLTVPQLTSTGSVFASTFSATLNAVADRTFKNTNWLRFQASTLTTENTLLTLYDNANASAVTWQIAFAANNSGSLPAEYGRLAAQIVSNTSASQSGAVVISTAQAGVLTPVADFTNLGQISSVTSGSAVAPNFTFRSEKSTGLYWSGLQTIAQSQGTLNLAKNAVRLSMRTLAASSVTASAAKTNVAVDEVVFTIGGASGASLIIYSGGTAYGFNSAFSAAAS